MVEESVLVGHYAVALMAKRAKPRIHLGALVLAAMFADIVWCIFMIFGLEHVQFGMGRGAGKYFHATNIALSHSLLMDLVWAAVLAAGYMLFRRSWLGCVGVFILVLSHWPLDVISHQPDMPIAPGVHTYIGLGLWNSIPATLVVEGGLWCIAIVLYVRVTRTNGLFGAVFFWCGILFLTLLWLANIAGPPPQNLEAAPFVSLIVFCATVVWAYWVNQVRPVTRSNGNRRSTAEQ